MSTPTRGSRKAIKRNYTLGTLRERAQARAESTLSVRRHLRPQTPEYLEFIESSSTYTEEEVQEVAKQLLDDFRDESLTWKLDYGPQENSALDLHVISSSSGSFPQVKFYDGQGPVVLTEFEKTLNKVAFSILSPLISPSNLNLSFLTQVIHHTLRDGKVITSHALPHLSCHLDNSIYECLRIMLHLQSFEETLDQAQHAQLIQDVIELLYTPTTLRVKQFVFIFISELDDLDTFYISHYGSKNRSWRQLSSRTPVHHLSAWLAATLSDNYLDTPGSPYAPPYGGRSGFTRMISRAMANISRHRGFNAELLPHHSLFLNYLNRILTTQQEVILHQQRPDDDLRATLYDLLMIFTHLLVYMAKSETPSPAMSVDSFTELTNNLSVDSFTELTKNLSVFLDLCFQPHPLHPPVLSSKPFATRYLIPPPQTKLYYVLSEDTVLQCMRTRTDLLIPGCIFLNRLVEFAAEIRDTWYPPIIQSIVETTLLKDLWKKCLMSQHYRLVLEATIMLSFLSGSTYEHAKLVLQLAPVLSRLLGKKHSMYCVNRHILITFLKLMTVHESKLFLEVLHTQILPQQQWEDYVQANLPNFKEHQVDDIEPCYICRKVTLIDLVLNLIHRHEPDHLLLEYALDFLELVLDHDDSYRDLLNLHGIIDIVESIQLTNQEKLFQRALHFVRKYYDGFEPSGPQIEKLDSSDPHV